MAAIDAVSPATATPTTSDPGSETASGDLQKAFSEGIVRFMGIMLQSAENDTIDSINDTTSTPDAPA